MDPEIFQKIWPVFRAEAAEHLEALTSNVLQLEMDPARRPAGVLDAVRRAAHSLKGSAGSLGLGDIERIAHAIEDAVGSDERSRARPEMVASVMRALQAIEETLGRIERGGPATVTGADGLIDELRHAGSYPWVSPSDAPQTPVTTAADDVTRTSIEGVPARVDRALRVSEKALDSLSLQLEDLAMSVGRQEKRSRDLRGQASRVSFALERCEQALARLRRLDDARTAALLEESISTLRALHRDLGHLLRDAAREVEHLRLVSTVVRNELRDLRMVPASAALAPLRRTVRDLADRLKKQALFVASGGEVHIDRRIVDALKEPLLHLVRNAVDHGLEPPERRLEAGKSATGRIEVRVTQHGHRVRIEVSDDGAGLSLERLRSEAVRRGLVTESAAGDLADDQVARLVFAPGLSTAQSVTAISGRGVGLDVVHEVVERLQGTVDVSFRAGRGTTFTLDLPLTLAATLVVIVDVGRDRVAIPTEHVERIVRLGPEQLSASGGRLFAHVDGRQLPYTPLSQAFGGNASAGEGGPQPALVLSASGQSVVFAVDRLVAHEEVVVHSLGRYLQRATHLAGAAVLEGGAVVAVLNVPELVRKAQPAAQRNGSQRRRVLLADDSLTTRSAMKALLERAGYLVVTARDGEEAWRILKESPVGLVVTDVQMPGLDGLELTRRIRSDPETKALPVVLVTSLESATDRAAGLDAGASAYLVKREVDSGQLVELVRRLFPDPVSRADGG